LSSAKLRRRPALAEALNIPANITNADLSELDLLSRAAVPGPWEVDHTKIEVEPYFVIHTTGTICLESEEQPGDFEQDLRDMIAADFAFVAAARTAVPALVAEVRWLRRRAEWKSGGP
jgi:hypothetical protein